jgi:hemoglobin
VTPPHADLNTRADVHDLVVAFYREVVMDDVLGPVFDEVAEVDWTVHIPRLIDYWCRILLDEPVYHGSLQAAHREVHQRAPFETHHFDRWYGLWADTIDARWQGPTALLAKEHAARTAALLSRTLRGEDWSPPGTPTARYLPLTAP